VRFSCAASATHIDHAHLAKTLEWIDRVQPQAVLTNMHIDLDYATLAAGDAEYWYFDGLT
jgi:phosphoribosyl 1,2-cyclic phosphate phosphodiesterase